MLKILDRPVPAQERIETIDIIRGIALFGILIINYTVDSSNAAPEDGWTGILDQITYWGIRLLLDDRFVAIYCFLFGLGFSLILFRAESKKKVFFPVFLWRLIILYIIGVTLDIFTDISILPAYAMIGVLLLLVYKLPYKILPALALVLFIGPRVYRTSMLQDQEQMQKQWASTKAKVDSSVLDKYVGVYHVPLNNTKHVITRRKDTLVGDGPARHYKLIPQNDSTFYRADARALITFKHDQSGNVNGFFIKGPQRTTSAVRIDEDMHTALLFQQQQQKITPQQRNPKTYREFVSRNWNNYKTSIQLWSWSNFFLWGNTTFNLPLFLMGLYFGRRRILQDVNGNRAFIKSLLRWGLILGGLLVAASVAYEAYVYINKFKEASLSIAIRQSIGALEDFGAILMALAYIAVIALLCTQVNWKKTLSFFAPVGRMGLTNYILHTLPAVILFETFNLNLTKEIGCFWRLIIALPVCFAIYLLSSWWFRHFQIGPAEWLWRSATYLKLQPLKIKKAIAELPKKMNTSVTVLQKKNEDEVTY